MDRRGAGSAGPAVAGLPAAVETAKAIPGRSSSEIDADRGTLAPVSPLIPSSATPVIADPVPSPPPEPGSMARSAIETLPSTAGGARGRWIAGIVAVAVVLIVAAILW